MLPVRPTLQARPSNDQSKVHLDQPNGNYPKHSDNDQPSFSNAMPNPTPPLDDSPANDEDTGTILPSLRQQESHKTFDMQSKYLGKIIGSGLSGQVVRYQHKRKRIVLKIFDFDHAEAMERELHAYRLIAASAALHNHFPRCYGRARIPKLFIAPGCFKNPHPFAIALEDVKGVEFHKAAYQLSDDRLQEIEGEAKQVLEDLRTECGIVHGDVRAPNFIVTKDSWFVVDLGHCEFRDELAEGMWEYVSRLDDRKCQEMVRNAIVVNAAVRGTKILQDIDSMSPDSIEEQLSPILHVVREVPRQALVFVNSVVSKIVQPTVKLSILLVQILRGLGHFNDARAQISKHLSNPSTSLEDQTYLHEQRVCIAQDQMKLLVSWGRPKYSVRLLSALEAKLEIFSTFHGKADIETIMVRYELWDYFVKERNIDRAKLVFDETSRLINEEHGKVGKDSELGEFWESWEEEKIGRYDQARKRKRL